jgi:hypothetical protein
LERRPTERLVFFIDVNMPARETYNKPPIEYIPRHSECISSLHSDHTCVIEELITPELLCWDGHLALGTRLLEDLQ